MPPEFLRGLRALCDEHGLLLIFDEVQTGVGRTGKLFAHEWAGVTPDIMAIAKGIGGGFPLGACLATAEAAKGMTAGTHGSTFGGNPLAMAVGNAVLDVVLAPGFLETCGRRRCCSSSGWLRVQGRHPARHRGSARRRPDDRLKHGHAEHGRLIDALRAEKLLAVGAGDNVVRLLPPLIVSDEEFADAAARLTRACESLSAQQTASAKAEMKVGTAP